MKRFFKYSAVFLVLIGLSLMALLLSSWVQRFCLSTILHCYFKEVVIEDYHGGLASISANKISAKGKNQSFEIKDFKLEWAPWRLMFFRELRVYRLQGHLNLECAQNFLPKDNVCEAGWGIKLFGKKEDKFSFLNRLQPPVKLNLDQVNINLNGRYRDICWNNVHVELKNVKPGQMGECQYTATVSVPLNSDKINAQINGSLQTSLNEKSRLCSIKCNGGANISNNEKKLPKIIYTVLVGGKDASTQEYLKLAIHCGQANDFTLLGESFTTTDRVYDFKWQGIFDHSLLKIFFPQYTPVLSLLAEGDCYLKRKSLTWVSHTYLSAWAKHFEVFDPSLKMLPSLSFKANLDADFDASGINFKQYKLAVKEKGAQRLFFDLNGLQSLVYKYKTGFEKPKKDSQLAEINFYEIPFEVFNPYLQRYKYQIRGCLNTGTLNFSWDSNKNQWNLSTLQPLYFHIQNLDFDGQKLLANVDGHIKEQCAFQKDMSMVEFNSDVLLTDTKFMPFFKFAPKGYIRFSKGKCSLQVDGVVNFNHYYAKDLLHLESLNVKVHPELCLDGNYDIYYNDDKISLKKLNVNLRSALEYKQWLSLNLLQHFTFSQKNWTKFDNLGRILTLKCNNCPINLVEAGELSLNGNLCCNSEISLDSGAIKLVSQEPLQVDQLQVAYKKQDVLNLKQAKLTAQGQCSKEAWSCNLSDIDILSNEKGDALLSGHVNVDGKSNNVVNTEGQFKLNLDLLSMQPFALKYPGFIGTISGHWDCSDKERIANGCFNVGCLDFPLNVDVKMSYDFKPKDMHHLKSVVELRDKDHVSDVSLDFNMDEKGRFDGHMNSEKVFLKDLLATIVAGQKLTTSFIKTKNLPKIDSSDASESILKPAASKDKGKVEFKGVCDFKFKSVVAGDEVLRELVGDIDVKKDTIVLKELKGWLCDGAIHGNGQYSFVEADSGMKVSMNGEEIQLSKLWSIPGELGYPLEKYGQITGKMNFDINGYGDVKNPRTLRGGISLKADDGDFRIINNASMAGQMLGGLTTSLGLALGANFSGMSTVGFLTSYLKSIPFNVAELDVQRSTDDRVDVKTSLLNNDFAFYTDNTFATEKNKNWKDQSFVSRLQLNASKASAWMNYFDFDTDNSDALGYCQGPSCTIDGTLAKPNYSALLGLIINRPKEEKGSSTVQQLLHQFF